MFLTAYLVGIGLWFLPSCYLLYCFTSLGLVGFLTCLICLAVGCFKVFLILLIVCYSVWFICFI